MMGLCSEAFTRRQPASSIGYMWARASPKTKAPDSTTRKRRKNQKRRKEKENSTGNITTESTTSISTGILLRKKESRMGLGSNFTKARRPLPAPTTLLQTTTRNPQSESLPPQLATVKARLCFEGAGPGTLIHHHNQSPSNYESRHQLATREPVLVPFARAAAKKPKIFNRNLVQD